MLLALLACHAKSPVETGDTANPADTSDTADVAEVLERRLRANYEQEEGLNLADGQVVVLGANNETEPDAEHADLHVSLGRYIGLATYTSTGEGRFCPVGEGFSSIADVPGTCAADWTMNILCAVNATASEPACAGQGFLVHPLESDAPYRMRIVTDDIVADGDYLAGVTLEVQALD